MGGWAMGGRPRGMGWGGGSGISQMGTGGPARWGRMVRGVEDGSGLSMRIFGSGLSLQICGYELILQTYES